MSMKSWAKGFDRSREPGGRLWVSPACFSHLYSFPSPILFRTPLQYCYCDLPKHIARGLVETTKGFIRFSITRKKTVGGPVEIAAITKHEGFKWVQRKHFFSAEFDRPT
jgi:hypothetical protein